MADPNSPLSRLQIWRATLPPALRFLLTANLALFAVVAVFGILRAFGLGAPYQLLEFLALPGDPGTALLRPWTPLTYGFIDLVFGDALWWVIGFAFAMYWLNWLGRDYEESYGGHQLVGLYVGSAVFGALAALAINAVALTPLARAVYAGAWGPVTAVLVATATLHPNRGVGLFLLGVVPMKWIAVAFVVLSLFRPDATLLGAAFFGLLFALAQKRGLDLGAWARPFFGRSRRRKKVAPAVTREKRPAFARAVRQAPAPAGASRSVPPPPAATDVDRILDKILERGYESLTADERRILDEASRD